MSDLIIRRARTGDVRAIHRIVQGYVDRGVLLGKELVTLYEDVQDFRVAEGSTERWWAAARCT